MEPNIDRSMWSVVVLLAAVILGGVLLIAIPKVSSKMINSVDESVDLAFVGEKPVWVKDSNSVEYYEEQLQLELNKELDNLVSDKEIVKHMEATTLTKINEQEYKLIGKDKAAGIRIPLPKSMKEGENYVLRFKLKNIGDPLDFVGGHLDFGIKKSRLFLDGKLVKEKVFSSPTKHDYKYNTYYNFDVLIPVDKRINDGSFSYKEKSIYIQPNRLIDKNFEVLIKDIELVKLERPIFNSNIK